MSGFDATSMTTPRYDQESGSLGISLMAYLRVVSANLTRKNKLFIMDFGVGIPFENRVNRYRGLTKSPYLNVTYCIDLKIGT